LIWHSQYCINKFWSSCLNLSGKFHEHKETEEAFNETIESGVFKDVNVKINRNVICSFFWTSECQRIILTALCWTVELLSWFEVSTLILTRIYKDSVSQFVGCYVFIFRLVWELQKSWFQLKSHLLWNFQFDVFLYEHSRSFHCTVCCLNSVCMGFLGVCFVSWFGVEF
jgi:hypothetical protein